MEESNKGSFTKKESPRSSTESNRIISSELIICHPDVSLMLRRAGIFPFWVEKSRE